MVPYKFSRSAPWCRAKASMFLLLRLQHCPICRGTSPSPATDGRDAKAAAQLDGDIARLGLGERVTVLGAVSAQRIAELYAEADIFALASRFEGYGMAYSEAIAHGLPVVGTRAGAIPDTVPANAGILVEPDDVPAFAVALRRLIADADERKRLAAAARAAAAKLPTWQDSAKIVARTLETLT